MYFTSPEPETFTVNASLASTVQLPEPETFIVLVCVFKPSAKITGAGYTNRQRICRAAQLHAAGAADFAFNVFCLYVQSHIARATDACHQIAQACKLRLADDVAGATHIRLRQRRDRDPNFDAVMVAHIFFKFDFPIFVAYIRHDVVNDVLLRFNFYALRAALFDIDIPTYRHFKTRKIIQIQRLSYFRTFAFDAVPVAPILRLQRQSEYQ